MELKKTIAVESLGGGSRRLCHATPTDQRTTKSRHTLGTTSRPESQADNFPITYYLMYLSSTVSQGLVSFFTYIFQDVRGEFILYPTLATQ